MNPSFKPIAITGDTVVLTRKDYDALLGALEDASDRAAIRASKRDRPDALPSALVSRLLAGESPVRIWREHRGLTGHKLAKEAGVSPSYLHAIETGEKPGSAKTLKALAGALRVDLGDLAP